MSLVLYEFLLYILDLATSACFITTEPLSAKLPSLYKPDQWLATGMKSNENTAKPRAKQFCAYSKNLHDQSRMSKDARVSAHGEYTAVTVAMPQIMILANSGSNQVTNT